MSEKAKVDAAVHALLMSDAMTGNDEGTPSGYYVDAENVEYLVRTVLDAAESATRPAPCGCGWCCQSTYPMQRGQGHSTCRGSIRQASAGTIQRMVDPYRKTPDSPTP